MTFVNSGGLALGKRSSMSLWLKSPSLAQIKPALSADRALGGEGTEYTCFCMFIEFKLTSFPLKDQQSFHKWIFDPLREKKKNAGERRPLLSGWQQGNSGMCCQGRPQDELEERQRALAEAELKYICSLISTDRREAYFNVPEVESALPAFHRCYKKIYTSKNKTQDWNINTNHISWL